MGTLSRKITATTRKPAINGTAWSQHEMALIRAARGGQAAAFDELVMRHQSALYNVAYRILGDGELAFAATREALVQGRETLAAFRGGAFRLWLMGFLVRICRAWMAEPATGLLTRGIVAPGPTPGMGYGPDPDRADASETQVHDANQACLNTVSPEERIVLVLADIAGLSYREVALVTGVPVTMVRSRLSCGRTMLRDTLLGQLAPTPVDAAWYPLSCAPC